MDCSWPENLSGERKKAAQKLIQGREQADRLRAVLSEPFGDDGLAAAKDLALSILGSFTEAISVLNRQSTDEASDQIPANTRVNSACWDGRAPEYSDESSKTSALKDRRGCYKRRKTPQTSTRITPTLIDDGHAWRKYGQKIILNSKHPRSYYRCTHKFDEGCQATKQVQRTDDDDQPMYRTAYHGHHTCRNPLPRSPDQFILDSTIHGAGTGVGAGESSSSQIISFGSTNPSHKSDQPYFPSFPPLKRKESFKEEKSSSSGYLLSPDLTKFEFSGPITAMSSGSDHGDVISSGRVYSCATSDTDSPNWDMDIFFPDDLQFDFS
ncbi:hypothetical protein U1Q18_013744 [Sarracenia purpurea var. burkii]